MRELPMTDGSKRIFYGWWIVVAAFLNLFFAVGIIFYGFPVFYPALAEALGFTRAQLTQGFLLGFLIVGLPFGLVAGAVIVAPAEFTQVLRQKGIEVIEV
jgi:hypothetical protein